MALSKLYSEIKKQLIQEKIEGLMSFGPNKFSLVEVTKLANKLYKQELKMVQDCGLTEEQSLDSWSMKLTGREMYDKFIK
jgi:hypothetical protein